MSEGVEARTNVLIREYEVRRIGMVQSEAPNPSVTKGADKIMGKVECFQGIYKITDKTNGKCYIGQAQNILNRWSGHLQKESAEKMLISQIIQEKGYHNFTFEIVELIDDSSKLDEAEIKWIAYYNSFYDGYNETKGGQQHYLGQKLYFNLEELVEYWDTHPYETTRTVANVFNIHHTTVQKILKQYGREFNHSKRRVTILNKETNETKDFQNCADAARFIKDLIKDNNAIRTIQKHLSQKGVYKNFTIIEKAEGEEIVHTH